MRFLVYWALRRQKLCASPALCPYSEDDETHGPDCAATRIEQLITESSAGALLMRAEEIDFALRAGFQLTLADVTAEEFVALQVVQMERDRWDQERNRSAGTQHL